MMQEKKPVRVGMEEKLGVNKFNIDEGNPHIVVDKAKITTKEMDKLIKACPAALYDLEEDGSLKFDYAGCLECGTCRVLCGETLLELWRYPQGTLGIEFRYG